MKKVVVVVSVMLMSLLCSNAYSEVVISGGRGK